MSFLKRFRGRKVAIWGLSRQSACQWNITLGHNVTSVRLDFIYTCSSMWSTAVWLQSSHRKHPLMSGVKAGPGVERYYLHTHTHTHEAARTFDSWVKGQCSFIVSFKTTDTHTHMQHIHSYLSLPSKAASTGRKRKKEREKRMKDRNTKVPTLSFIRAAESPWQPE